MLEASQRGFIGLSIFPIFETPLQSADYPIIPLESLLKLQETKRAPRGSYNRSDYEFKTGTYACAEYGWEEPVDDSEAALYRRYFDAEEVAVKRCVDVILRNQEARIAAAIMNTGNITATSNVAIEWSTPATAVPRANINTAKAAMRAASGLVPNVIAMSKKVFDNTLMIKEITDAMVYTNPLQIGGEEAQRRILAQYFGVDEILVGGAIKDSAKKGQSSSIADLWDPASAGRSSGRRTAPATSSRNSTAKSRPAATSIVRGTTWRRPSSSRAPAICSAISRRRGGPTNKPGPSPVFRRGRPFQEAQNGRSAEHGTIDGKDGAGHSCAGFILFPARYPGRLQTFRVGFRCRPILFRTRRSGR
jgi:hypothetical protein